MEVCSVEAIHRAMNDAGVEHLIVGGLSVNTHGFQRPTNVADLGVGLQRENIKRGSGLQSPSLLPGLQFG